jgi:hypothetical protein
MDFITDLPPYNDHDSTTILVITDRLGKGSILLPVLPEKFDTESITLLLIERYVPFYWIPRSIISDRGTQFVNVLKSHLYQLLGIK